MACQASPEEKRAEQHRECEMTHVFHDLHILIQLLRIYSKNQPIAIYGYRFVNF